MQGIDCRVNVNFYHPYCNVVDTSCFILFLVVLGAFLRKILQDKQLISNFDKTSMASSVLCVISARTSARTLRKWRIFLFGLACGRG